MKSTVFSLFALVLGLSAPNGLPGQQKTPNMIFIMADDLGYGDLGCFSQEKILTPHIDRLAEEGTRFTQFYAGSPVCAPARCVLLTGLHAGHARIRSNGPKVGGQLEAFGEGGMRLSMLGNEPTVASALKRGGYATGISGKWGLGEPGTNGIPNKMGFDEWLGYLNQNHAPYYFTDFLWHNEEKQAIPENQDGKREVYSNDLMRDFAIEFLRKNRDGPFFLYLPFTIPHSLMEVPSLGVYAEKDWSEPAKIFAAMVTRLDSYVGEINAELKRLDLEDNTVVFFTSDNGPVDRDQSYFFNSAVGRRGTKGTVYEGGLLVPLVVRWPGVTPAGEVNDLPWMFVDAFPTLCDIAGISYPDNLDGISILPTLQGRKQDVSQRTLYWEFPKDRLWQAVRRDKWKGVRYGMDQPLELYDLDSDPSEMRNVASIHKDVVAEFEEFMGRSHTPSPHWPVD